MTNYKKILEAHGIKATFIAAKMGLTPSHFKYFIDRGEKAPKTFVTQLKQVLKELADGVRGASK